MRRVLSRALRDAVLRRARSRCEYCLSPLSLCPDPFTIDHIVPVARQGDDTLENLALSCAGCNGPKSKATDAVDPETDTLVPLFHPRRDTWVEHFAWSDSFDEILGRTPIGRATISRLKLNRTGVVNLRRMMRLAGEDHPPSWTKPEAGT